MGTEKISDPEARNMAERAYKTLKKAAGEGAADTVVVEPADAAKILLEALGADANEVITAHVACMAAAATNMKLFDASVWKNDVGYAPFDAVIEAVRAKMTVSLKEDEEMEDEDLEGVDLYKGNFSLAYGTLTLLRDAKMHLKQNRFYGLLGPNQCGKTTLMRAIVGEKLEGFPKQDELASIFVEHEIEEEEVGVQDDGFPILSVDKPGWWWVMHTCNDIYKLEVPVTEDQCNVLMLDEPTGHLDVDNIRWLEAWLEAFPGSIIC